jgi:hypothetical protein
VKNFLDNCSSHTACSLLQKEQICNQKYYQAKGIQQTPAMFTQKPMPCIPRIMAEDNVFLDDIKLCSASNMCLGPL